MVSGHLSTNSALLIDLVGTSGVFPALLVADPGAACTRAPDSQRPRVAPSEHARCEAPVKKGPSVLSRHPRRLPPTTDLELVVDVGKNSRKLDPNCRRSL